MVPLIADQPIQSAAVMAAYEQIFVVLREAGWQEEELLPLVRSMEYLAIGSSLDHDIGTPEEADRTFAFAVQTMLMGLERRLGARQALDMS